MNMVHSVEGSLRRLGTGRVDLYWVHFAGGHTPTEEIARGLEDLMRDGKALYVGYSDFPAWRVARATTLAELRGWAAVAGIQVEYSLAERTAEREPLPMAEGFGLGLTLWSPLGGGLLTGKHLRGKDGRHTAGGGPVRQEGERKRTIVDTVHAVAGARGNPGAGRHRLGTGQGRAPARPYTHSWRAHAAQLNDNLGAHALSLDDTQVARLDAAAPFRQAFRMSFSAPTASAA